MGTRGEVSSGNGHQEGCGTMLLHKWAVFSSGHQDTIGSDRCCNSLRVRTCLGRDGSRDIRGNVHEKRITMDGSTHGPRASAPHHRRAAAAFFFISHFFKAEYCWASWGCSFPWSWSKCLPSFPLPLGRPSARPRGHAAASTASSPPSGGWHGELSAPMEGWLMGPQQCPKLCTYLEGGKGHEESTAQLFSTAESLGRGLGISYSCPGGQRRAEVGMKGQACMDTCATAAVHPAVPDAQPQCPPGALDTSPFCPWFAGGWSPAHIVSHSIPEGPSFPSRKLLWSSIPAAGGKCWGRLHLPTAVMSPRAVSWPASLVTIQTVSHRKAPPDGINTEECQVERGCTRQVSAGLCEKHTNAAAAVYRTLHLSIPHPCAIAELPTAYLTKVLALAYSCCGVLWSGARLRAHRGERLS